jgi:enoyl-CoA hydratase
MYESILVDTQGGVATITLNRPKALNALNSTLFRELDAAITALSADTRVVIVTGAGEKAFVAGADIVEMQNLTPRQAQGFCELSHTVGRKLEAAPYVTIAAINGFALGGGLELAMSCDLLYAAEHARLGQPEVNLGVIPGFGGTQRLARLVGPQLAREMCFTGDFIDAATAKARGLVCDVLPKEKLLEHVRGVADKILKKGPLAIAAAKRAIRRGQDLDLENAMRVEAYEFGLLFDTADQKEGMKAFAEKRPAQFTGA